MVGGILVCYGLLNTIIIMVLRYFYACRWKTIHRLADDFLADALVAINAGLSVYLSLIEYIRYKSAMAPFIDFCKGIDWSISAEDDPPKGVMHHVFTLAVFVIGQAFHPMMMRIIEGNEAGNGMVESAIMIFQHRNPNSGIDAKSSTQAMVERVDNAAGTMLSGASSIIPDFSIFSQASTYIGNGFDVPWSTSILPALMTFIGFFVPCVLIGAACLKFRELEAK